MKNIFYRILFAAVLTAFIAAESCVVPIRQKAMLVLYDSLRNVTQLRSAREIVEIRQPATGREAADLYTEAFYECPGSDTNCLPIGLRIRWTLVAYRTSRQIGSDFTKINTQRFRTGDNITVVGKHWNMTFLVDSIASGETSNIFFQGNNAYENIETISYFYCSARADRLLTLAEASSFTVTLAAGRQIFYKSGGAWKNIEEFCRRTQSKIHR